MMTLSYCTQFVSLFVLLLILSLSNAQQPCNGHPSLCPKRLNEVFYPMTHNSFAVGSYNTTGANQRTNITTQLQNGIRALNLDFHYSADNTTVQLCHGSCFILNRGPLVATLTEIRKWMEGNRRELVWIIVENGPPVRTQDIDNVVKASGIDRMLVQLTPGGQLPTLGELINADKRLLLHIVPLPAPFPPYMHPEFDWISETPFEQYSESAWTCAMDRPRNQARPFVLVNHWIYETVLGFGVADSNPTRVAATNSFQKMKDHINKCRSIRRQFVNFLNIDWYDNSEIFRVAADINQVPFVPKPSTNTNTSNSANNGSRARRTNNAAAILGLSYVTLGAMLTGLVFGL